MSGNPLPQAQVVDAHLLHADGIVYLYELSPATGGTIYLKADDSVVWQGHDYTGTAVQIDERQRNTDGTLSRPKLTLANPLAVFSPLVANGALDNALLVEKRVLRAHIDADVGTFQSRSWRIRRVIALNRVNMSFELRDSLDGPKFLLPARQFMPPDFPTVRL